MPNIDTDLLRSFVLIADSGSFTRAAAIVGRTQSAISMQVRRLEEIVGRPLFLRDGRRVTLTRHGEYLLEPARQMLALNDQVVAALREPHMSGRIRIGAPDDYATRYLPGILARFAATHPDVQVMVVCEPSVNLRRMLDEDELDLALVSVGFEPQDNEVVWRGPLVWVGSAQHRPQDQTPLPLVLSHIECSWRKAAERALEELGRPWRLAYTSTSQTGQIAAVLAGLAVGVMTPSLLPEGVRILGERDGFPPLPDFQIALAQSAAAPQPLADTLARHIAASFRAEAKAGAGMAGPPAGRGGGRMRRVAA